MTVNPADAPPSDPAPPASQQRWPGWPGDNVYRMIVPVVKVGGLIGKGGEIIKKLCEETGARVRILDGPLGTTDRVVLISGKEELEAEVPPAMQAVLRVFKHLNGTSGDGKTLNETGICSVRLVMASAQAIHLIGKQGSTIKSIQEESGAVIHVLTGDGRAFYANTDERIVDIQGEFLKVFKALEAVVGHLRKFLVDRSVIPLFEKNLIKPVTKDHLPDAWNDHRQSLIHSPQQGGIGNEYPLSLKRDSLFLDRDAQHESQLLHSTVSPYRQDPPAPRFSGPGSLASGVVTQVTQKMQIPIRYADDIIGPGGCNIAYIRARSRARVLVLETGRHDEIVVEITGTPTEVQIAQQLIEDPTAGHKEPVSYEGLERYGPSFSQLRDTAYPSSLTAQNYSRYGPYYGSGDSRTEPAFSQLADTAHPSSSSLGPKTYGLPELGDYSSYRY